ncbi:hypothetical protein J2W42_005936 [Rhizobium tibeticum]|nr:hypothetical protein [Rhizobium tibeticum]MDP9813065.1 hypothetical protein [Rhizobium tibeticum]
MVDYNHPNKNGAVAKGVLIMAMALAAVVAIGGFIAVFKVTFV